MQSKPLRHELKYPLSFAHYQMLRRKLRAVLKIDPHAEPEGHYHVRTLYFDDIKNSAYFEKMSGVGNRQKYRLRIYNLRDNPVKFERKSRIYNYVFKESEVIQREEAEKIINGDIRFLADSKSPLLRRFYNECRLNLMRPAVLSEYLREPYVYPVGNVRVTFDFDLRTSLVTQPVKFFENPIPTLRVDSEAAVIMEVKYSDVLPEVVRGLLSEEVSLRRALGKFALCRAARGILAI
ncbi:MAG: polyphosphate polymerase domain-containing protein [Nitrososphaerota archaeon]|nr:polyphosphate polymerase domain-containing protein [Candidatus Bathyarchaeota archaeon]MDW8022676.1 polyphosphate polymerase domain-containing protein [Nitrososphaerota archaeon]